MRANARLFALAGGVLLLAAVGLWLRHAPLFDAGAPTSIDRSAGAGPRGAPAPRRVLLISVDGLAPWVLARAQAPVLARLAREGTSAAHAETVLPSITMTAHTTMLSGLPPEQHGVTWNRYQPWSAVGVPTIFTACARQALRCGLFAGKAKFAHFAEAEPGVERYVLGADAPAVLAAALRYQRERDPDLVVVHLAEVDWAGHGQGWGSEAQLRAIAALDTALGGFLSEVRAAGGRPLAVLLTSDHGGHGTNHGSADPRDVEIPWLLWGDGVPVATLPQVSALDTAPTLMALLGLAPPPAWPGVARAPSGAAAPTAASAYAP